MRKFNVFEIYQTAYYTETLEQAQNGEGFQDNRGTGIILEELTEEEKKLLTYVQEIFTSGAIETDQTPQIVELFKKLQYKVVV